MSDNTEITKEEVSILREVGQISIGKILTSLQQILGNQIDMVFPKIELLNKEDTDKYFSEPQIRVGLHFNISKDLKGVLLYIFNKKDANFLIDVLNEVEIGTSTVLNEVEVTTIKEISNILSGAYLSALADLSGLTIIQSLPHFIFDSGDSICDLVLGHFDERKQKILLLKSNLLIKKSNFSFQGDIVLILPDDQLEKLLQTLKKKV